MPTTRARSRAEHGSDHNSTVEFSRAGRPLRQRGEASSLYGAAPLLSTLSTALPPELANQQPSAEGKGWVAFSSPSGSSSETETSEAVRETEVSKSGSDSISEDHAAAASPNCPESFSDVDSTGNDSEISFVEPLEDHPLTEDESESTSSLVIAEDVSSSISDPVP
ncbi:hypothetical protein I302_108007 [Kwoniella bestiolae CBS 10118]|uniref:Uncharacterized protein n=1 Tax=Kwoniella bestiolae CBS 10118 TaxID=1296100 RepID=A0A1B9FWY1_9TREE|nr:hypothetical protein I302_07628 [Kwoniella bestiolae CBS 10118]OCF23274.1 hypothetical protein I302_07628 [Kwoniella bestiolae CBS 10118]